MTYARGNGEPAEGSQAFQMLRLSAVELAELLRREAEINPFLQLVEPADSLVSSPQPPPDWTDWATRDDDPADAAWRAGVRDQSVEAAVSWKGLREHLLNQLGDLPQEDHGVVAFLVESLDEDGYLRISKHEVGQLLNLPREDINRCFRALQRLDPPGVGARSLRECILLQLKRRGLLTEQLQNVVLEDLAELAMHHYGEVAKKYGLSAEEIRRFARQIRSVEPKPGRCFQSGADQAIIPDLEVLGVAGGFEVRLMEEYLPVLSLDSRYRGLLQRAEDPEVKRYLQRSLQAAQGLIRQLEQRKELLLRIMQAIVERQHGFFVQGVRELKPLNLRAISGDTGIHESTVSRAVSAKYVETPRGTYPLKYFFLSGVEGDEGSVASRSVKDRIREIIGQEQPSKPLSDQKLAEILRSEGMDISRRTVAKYREELGIASSQGRKR